MRDYTAEDLQPLLEQHPQHKTKFLAETIPAFGAINTFNRLKQKYPDYSYREVSLNPTNPDDRATDWEADILSFMRDHPDRKLIIGDRETPTGPALYLASAMTADPQCMECHSRPAAAPAAMIASYGPDHGFGWKDRLGRRRTDCFCADVRAGGHRQAGFPFTDRLPRHRVCSRPSLRWMLAFISS